MHIEKAAPVIFSTVSGGENIPGRFFIAQASAAPHAT
jgi:hypothetical protein